MTGLVRQTSFEPLFGGRASDRPLIAIGDVHGFADPLARLIDHLRGVIETEHSERIVDVVFLGDYVDRGPEPRETLDLVRLGFEMSEDQVVEHRLLGNHDRYLANAAGLRGGRLDFSDWAIWVGNGGRETLKGLGDLPLRANANQVREGLGEDNAQMLEALSLSMTSGDVFCTHAGVRPDRTLDEQTEGDLVWIREPFLSAAERPTPRWRPGATIVHGHTPPAFGRFPHRIGVDTGGFATGVFSAIEIVDGAARFHHLKVA